MSIDRGFMRCCSTWRLKIHFLKPYTYVSRCAWAEVTPLWILHAGADFAHQPALHQPPHARTCSARRESDAAGYGPCRLPGVARQHIEYGLIGGIHHRQAVACHMQRDTKAVTDLLQQRQCESGGTARRSHALDTAAPLLDQSQFMEHAADGAIAESIPNSLRNKRVHAARAIDKVES